MVSPQEQAFRNVLTTRAATVVVGVLLSWPIVAGLVSALEYLLVIASPQLPPFAVRATLLVFASLVAFALLLRGLHLASLEPRPDVGRLTRAEWWAIAALVVASLAGSVAVVWLPIKTVVAIIDLWGSERLLAYSQDTAILLLLGHGIHAVTMSGAFVYSAARWDAARRRDSPDASPV
ncbi:hypothetical protein [Nannocystis sp. SCPEA4]|uniref:hypothetical protein n=1 Tax=Nannocystis sp. SCPEA4 TaxID=2996787 RepID=UPI002271F981|nr:hypothetical protein [Nannocystis sp. SCPEA4]MCY1061801.1 hypothetical protein [Nannocystis sp. SCPEA4]